MTRGPRREAGAVTAEIAVAVPALVLLLAVALAAVVSGVDRVRAVDAAHVGARVLARGEPAASAREAAEAVAPDGAEVALAVDGDLVRVRVGVRLPATLRALGVPPPGPVTATARSEAAGTGP